LKDPEGQVMRDEAGRPVLYLASYPVTVPERRLPLEINQDLFIHFVSSFIDAKYNPSSQAIAQIVENECASEKSDEESFKQALEDVPGY